ncbi:MAG: hypothetical protein R3A44_27750 [Caldilineaceae bacterium]
MNQPLSPIWEPKKRSTARPTPRLLLILGMLMLLFSTLLAACRDNLPAMPDLPDLPVDLPNIPGIPTSLNDLPGLIGELGLPDLSQITNLPGLDALPTLQDEPGVLTLQGPTERRVGVGERIPGTDVQLVAVNGSEAEFRIAGMRSVRVAGDSLDFDGDWPGVGGVTYHARLRLYHVGSDNIRAAGVHQLIVRNIQPVESAVQPGNFTLKFPVVASAGRGAQFKGLTLGYVGEDERGAQISGLPQNDYPYRKTGDSIVWNGQLRPDIPVQYSFRVLLYGADSLRIGGVVTISLPGS